MALRFSSSPVPGANPKPKGDALIIGTVHSLLLSLEALSAGLLRDPQVGVFTPALSNNHCPVPVWIVVPSEVHPCIIERRQRHAWRASASQRHGDVERAHRRRRAEGESTAPREWPRSLRRPARGLNEQVPGGTKMQHLAHRERCAKARIWSAARRSDEPAAALRRRERIASSIPIVAPAPSAGRSPRLTPAHFALPDKSTAYDSTDYASPPERAPTCCPCGR